MNILNLTLPEIVARIIVIFTAITVHEFSHGFVAYKLGDPTAKYSGRLTLNPIAHFDPLGALCMLLCGFGWAKPVPINPMYFRDRKTGSALTALAGPVSNILLTFLSTILAALFAAFVFIPHPNNATAFVISLFEQLALVNISFAVFNLIPVPPLDGSKIIGLFLSNNAYYKYMRYESFGLPILMILSITDVLGRILYVLVNPIYNIWFNFYMWLVNIML